MNQEKIKQAIDDYFNNITKEKFKSDLIDAGFSVTDNNNAGVYAMPGKPITVTGKNAKRLLKQLNDLKAKHDAELFKALTEPPSFSFITKP